MGTWMVFPYHQDGLKSCEISWNEDDRSQKKLSGRETCFIEA